MIETLLGGALGGLFRLAPEVLKWVDRKNERAHELSMQDKQLEFQKLTGQQRMEEIHAQEDSAWASGALDALKAGIEAQGKPSGVKWVDALNSLIRPVIALQWVILLYPSVLIASFVLSVMAGVPALVALVKVFGPDEKAICASILNFFFVGRVFDRALK